VQKTIITEQPKNHKAADGDDDDIVNDYGFHDADYDVDGIDGDGHKDRESKGNQLPAGEKGPRTKKLIF